MYKAFEWMLDHRMNTGLAAGAIIFIASYFTKGEYQEYAVVDGMTIPQYSQMYTWIGQSIAAFVFGFATFFFVVIALTIAKSILDK